MRDWRLWRYSRLLLLAALVVVGCASPVLAQSSSSSSSYKVSETQFGSSSTSESCSGSYCAKSSIGDLAVGDSKSASYSANFGPITTDDPLLEVIVETGDSNLGTLTTETTATKTILVKIRSYLSDGYVLQIVGDAPKYGGHTLATPSSPTASDPGTEQFGINAVNNSTPNVGANLVQVPSGQFSFGEVEDGYDIPNQFQYTSGDVVARSTTQSGRTDYTISMIINIANDTPSGHYSGDFSAVVIPAF